MCLFYKYYLRLKVLTNHEKKLTKRSEPTQFEYSNCSSSNLNILFSVTSNFLRLEVFEISKSSRTHLYYFAITQFLLNILSFSGVQIHRKSMCTSFNIQKMQIESKKLWAFLVWNIFCWIHLILSSLKSN